MNDELTPEDRNVLRAYIDTASGKKLLTKLVNQEITLLGESFNNKATLEKQGQNVNRVSGIYWVRTLIQDLTKPPEKPKK